MRLRAGTIRGGDIGRRIDIFQRSQLARLGIAVLRNQQYALLVGRQVAHGKLGVPFDVNAGLTRTGLNFVETDVLRKS